EGLLLLHPYLAIIDGFIKDRYIYQFLALGVAVLAMGSHVGRSIVGLYGRISGET
ncbi:hypothetical protein HAX54_006272, partial [Datura stramonium]|nr:hypothetical protein [Datura stramonium]